MEKLLGEMAGIMRQADRDCHEMLCVAADMLVTRNSRAERRLRSPGTSNR